MFNLQFLPIMLILQLDILPERNQRTRHETMNGTLVASLKEGVVMFIPKRTAALNAVDNALLNTKVIWLFMRFLAKPCAAHKEADCQRAFALGFLSSFAQYNG